MRIPLKSARFIVCTLVCLFAPLPVAAQWLPGGVNLGGYELGGTGAVSDGAGGVIVSWDDRRDGPYPNAFDVYAQRWDSLGNDLWGTGGTPVCSLASNAGNSVVVSDGANGAVVVWVDSRTTGDGSGIYAQHVDASGTHTWTYQGVLVTSAGSFISNMDAVADGSGGAVVAWVDYRSGGQLVYAQRINASGTPLWPGDVVVPEASGAHYTPRILETLDGGAIISWVAGPSINRDLYMQRLDATGARAWNSGVATPICTATGSQSTQRMTSDGAGGAVIAWEDRRFGDNIYAQRVNASGAVQWTADGVVVCDQEYVQSVPRLCPDGTGGAFIVWTDERDQGSGGGAPPRTTVAATSRITEPDIYMQRVDGSGTPTLTANGIVVSTAPYWQAPGQIVSDGAGGAVVAWTDDSDNDGNEDVILQRYDAIGSALWTPGGEVHAAGAGNRQIFGMVTDGGSNTIAVWTTFIETAAPPAGAAAVAPSNSITLQRVDNTNGQCTCQTSGVGPVHTARPLILTGAAPNPSSGRADLQLFLEDPADVTVQVFDVRGRRVAAERIGRSGRGWQTLRFDGRNLPSGIYFYRVSAGVKTTTRKIVIQR